MDLAAEHDPFTGKCMANGCCPCTECNRAESPNEDDGDNSRDRKAARTEGGAKVRKTTLEKLCARLQIPPEGHFDRTDIAWEGRKNQG